MNTQKILEGKFVILKNLSQEYIPDYLDMFSPVIQKILGVSSVWSEFEYVHTRLHKQDINKLFFYVIFKKADNFLIGSIEIRSPEHRGQLYTWLHEQYWSQGLFQEAFVLASRDYFIHNHQETNFTARVDISNQRSLKALLKLGCTTIRKTRGAREDQHELVCTRTVM